MRRFAHVVALAAAACVARPPPPSAPVVPAAHPTATAPAPRLPFEPITASNAARLERARATVPTALLSDEVLRQRAPDVYAKAGRFGTRIAADGRIAVVDLGTRTQLWSFEAVDARVVIDADGMRAASVRGEELTLHDGGNGRKAALGRVGEGELLFAGHPTRVIVAGASELAGVLAREQRWTTRCPAETRPAVVTKDRSLIVAGARWLCVVDADSGEVRADIATDPGYADGGYAPPKIAPNGTELAIFARGGTIRRWSLERATIGDELPPFALDGNAPLSPETFAWSSDGARMFVLAGGEVLVFAAAGGARIARYPVAPADGIAVSPSGELLATMRQGTGILYDAAGRERTRFACDGSVAFASEYVLSCGDDDLVVPNAR